MEENKVRVEPIDRWVIEPMKDFINNSTTSGIILFSSAAIALILANSPWSDAYHNFWHNSFSIGFGDHVLTKSLHHWINDGLMAIFFFVVGLELKREIIGGELSNPKNAISPLVAAVGGMLFPALIYVFFNSSGVSLDGWGIPMATDIAFALGVLYLLGDKVPIQVKIFLTVLAIADDIGAVLIIAFFYTSNINTESLIVGALFLGILILANRLGVRNTLFYGIVGILGLWLAFLMSGVHATIAAVLAAFTIPANPKITEKGFYTKLNYLLDEFTRSKPNEFSTVTKEQMYILEEIGDYSKKALTPLQRLEHKMHPIVAFIVMPIFALCNAGVTIDFSIISKEISMVTMGVFFGLIIGKLIGVVGLTYLFHSMKWAVLPKAISRKYLIAIGLLASIGFTMSLFISDLAFEDLGLIKEAKIGVLAASILASFLAYFTIKLAVKEQIKESS